jgi:hypothetical protein
LDLAAAIYRAAVQGMVDSLSADRAAVRIFDLDGVLRFTESVGLSDEHRAAVETGRCEARHTVAELACVPPYSRHAW